MIQLGDILWVLLLLPAVGAAASRLAPSPRGALAFVAWGVPAIGALAACVCARVLSHGPLLSEGGWLHLDALSAFHLGVMMLVFALCSVAAAPYFRDGADGHGIDRRTARRFASLWYGALGAMTLVLLSNNLGIMWVGVEATTLLTAFLICLHVSSVSLEATWKYLIVCSVGVAFAFMGVLLVAAALHHIPLDTHLLHWTQVRAGAAGATPALMKLAFVFLLVGYGTKAGLAPMHSWLPDAHSQAPAPVSALFSGFMLNMALYCIMRFVPLVEAATGHSGWAPNLLVLFGTGSILLAAVFVVAQRDLKRFLAYCSVEHLGIVALGIGLGPFGAFAALFHTLNHSLCKVVSFLAAGRVGQAYGTHDMRRIRASTQRAPLWGCALFASILALSGVAPFSAFLSEFYILKAAAGAGRHVVMVLFLLGVGIVFIGSMKHAVGMAWGRAEGEVRSIRPSAFEWLVAVAPLALCVLLGVWMPPTFVRALEAAAAIVTGDAP